MRKLSMLVAAGSALAMATPAMAQLGGALGGVTGGATGSIQGGVAATVDPVTGTTDTVNNTTARTGDVVNKVDRTVQSKVDATKLRVASTQDVRSGVHVMDSDGNSIGTVQKISGGQAVVVDGSKIYNVPVSQLYAQGAGKAKHLMTKVPRASLTAQANANANSAVKTGG